MKRKKPRIIKGVPRVVDGDTLCFKRHPQAKDRKDLNVRLADIDAPEENQMCRNAKGELYDAGAEATGAMLNKLAGQKVVRCEVVGCTLDGRRPLATCYVGKTNLNKWIVEQGHALVDPKYCQRYVCQEDAARKAKRGLWAGKFIRPWEWRRRKKKGMPVDL